MILPQESLLNGCIEPTSIIYDFKADLSASGNFKHQRLNVNAMFYTLNDNDTPSPYLVRIYVFFIHLITLSITLYLLIF